MLKLSKGVCWQIAAIVCDKQPTDVYQWWCKTATFLFKGAFQFLSLWLQRVRRIKCSHSMSIHLKSAEAWDHPCNDWRDGLLQCPLCEIWLFSLAQEAAKFQSKFWQTRSSGSDWVLKHECFFLAQCHLVASTGHVMQRIWNVQNRQDECIIGLLGWSINCAPNGANVKKQCSCMHSWKLPVSLGMEGETDKEENWRERAVWLIL